MTPVERMKFCNDKAEANYRHVVGTHGTPSDRQRRAEQWEADNTDAWRLIPDASAGPTHAELEAFKYRIEQPKAAAVNPVDSRPASEGYDHFDFDHQHPALRR